MNVIWKPVEAILGPIIMIIEFSAAVFSLSLSLSFAKLISRFPLGSHFYRIRLRINSINFSRLREFNYTANSVWRGEWINWAAAGFSRRPGPL